MQYDNTKAATKMQISNVDNENRNMCTQAESGFAFDLHGIARQILRTPLIASNVAINARGSAQNTLTATSPGSGI